MYTLAFMVLANIFVQIDSTNPGKVNLALETVIEFDQQDLASDLKFIDDVQKFLNKVKRILYKDRVKSRRMAVNEDTLFTNFVMSVINILSEYDDNDLEQLAVAVDGEIKKVIIKDNKVGEFVRNASMRRFVENKLDKLKVTHPVDIRNALYNALEVIQNDGLPKKVKGLLDFMDSLYGLESANQLLSVIDNLESYKNKAKRSSLDLNTIIGNGLSEAVFDHYSKLNLHARRDLRVRLESIWVDYGGASEDVQHGAFEAKLGGPLRSDENDDDEEKEKNEENLINNAISLVDKVIKVTDNDELYEIPITKGLHKKKSHKKKSHTKQSLRIDKEDYEEEYSKIPMTTMYYEDMKQKKIQKKVTRKSTTKSHKNEKKRMNQKKKKKYRADSREFIAIRNAIINLNKPKKHKKNKQKVNKKKASADSDQEQASAEFRVVSHELNKLKNTSCREDESVSASAQSMDYNSENSERTGRKKLVHESAEGMSIEKVRSSKNPSRKFINDTFLNTYPDYQAANNKVPNADISFNIKKRLDEIEKELNQMKIRIEEKSSTARNNTMTKLTVQTEPKEATTRIVHSSPVNFKNKSNKTPGLIYAKLEFPYFTTESLILNNSLPIFRRGNRNISRQNLDDNGVPEDLSHKEKYSVAVDASKNYTLKMDDRDNLKHGNSAVGAQKTSIDKEKYNEIPIIALNDTTQKLMPNHILYLGVADSTNNYDTTSTDGKGTKMYSTLPIFK